MKSILSASRQGRPLTWSAPQLRALNDVADARGGHVAATFEDYEVPIVHTNLLEPPVAPS
jgi:hypothetical protein